MITLHYSEEVLPDEGIAPKEGKIETSEKTRIKKSIMKMMTEFDPKKYADKRREKVMDLLKMKMKEHPPVEAPAIEEEEGDGPPDLVAALEEIMRDMKKSR